MRADELRRLLDREEITDRLADLALGPDLADWDRYERCFADDLEVVNPHFSGDQPRRCTAADWAASVRGTQAHLDARHHLLTSPSIHLDGDTADVTLLQAARFELAGVPGGSVYRLGGNLRLRFVRTGAGWRVARLRFQVTWSDGNRQVYEEARRRGHA